MTGTGAITAAGAGTAALWDAVFHGRSMITPLTDEHFAGVPVRIGGQVSGWNPDGLLQPALARRLSPVQHWAYGAVAEALAAAAPTALPSASAPPELPWQAERVSVIAATGSGPIDAMQQATRALDTGGPRAVPLALAVYGAADAITAIVSQHWGFAGQSQAISATCASGAIGIGEAMRRIRHGYADAVVVVGMEDCLGPVNLAANANLRALASGWEDNPSAASRPFDSARAGFVMAAGAVAVVLEAADVAAARGAEVLATVSGFGASNDAHHATAPHPEGAGAAAAVRAALIDSGLRAEDSNAIHAINAHGTSTRAGDAAELRAFGRVFGDRAQSIPISATKSTTGHLLGAAGVAEAVISALTLHTGTLPPTINLDDPEYPDWDIVTRARPTRVERILSTSFGFGGHNAALVLSAAPVHRGNIHENGASHE